MHFREKNSRYVEIHNIDFGRYTWTKRTLFILIKRGQFFFQFLLSDSINSVDFGTANFFLLE